MILFACNEAVESTLVKLQNSQTYSETSPNGECSINPSRV